MTNHEDDVFIQYVAQRRATLCVQAVSLGGSRATGEHRALSHDQAHLNAVIQEIREAFTLDTQSPF